MTTKNKKPTTVLTEEEAHALLRRFGKQDRLVATGFISSRNQAMAAMMLYAGLRVSETCDLRLEDVELGRNRVHVRSGKNGRERWATLLPAGVRFIEGWVKRRTRRNATGLLDDAHFFCGWEGQRVLRKSIQRTLARMGQRAGISKRVYPHCLRHTHAVMLRGMGVDLRALQLQLGHTSLATTAVYLDRFAIDVTGEILAAAEGRHAAMG